MAINKTKRVEFGKMLKLLLTKYSIKQKKLADLLSRAPQYISAVIAGHRSFTGEQCNIIKALSVFSWIDLSHARNKSCSL